MERILVLCTGNSCRSQIAEAIIKRLKPGAYVVSAGTSPEKEVHPKAIQVLVENGITTADLAPKSVDQFINDDFDFVFTVCDNARETCPVFMGKVNKRVHLGFEDPAKSSGTDEEITAIFRETYKQIQERFESFFQP